MSTPDSPDSIPPPVGLTTDQKLDDVQKQLALLLASMKAAPDLALLAQQAAQNLYALLQSAQAAATAADPVVSVTPPVQPTVPVVQTLPPLSVQPPVLVPPTQSQFTVPLAPLNSPSGVPPSIRVLFPDIESACITLVITHKLKAVELYKLDVCIKDSEPSYSFSATGALEMNMLKHKAYRNLNSIVLPLHTYFAILSAHLPTQTTSSVYFYRYLTHLTSLAVEYEWPAVLEYHTLFFNRRRGDMLSGSYEQWGVSDIGLLSSHVYPHCRAIHVTPPKGPKRPPSTGTAPCQNYNLGMCESPCNYGHVHVCLAPSCGKDHPLIQHPKKGPGQMNGISSTSTQLSRLGHPTDVPVITVG